MSRAATPGSAPTPGSVPGSTLGSAAGATTPLIKLANEDDWLAAVKAKAQGLRYGVIQIVFHDAKPVQIERTERIRLYRAGDSGGAGDMSN